MDATPLNTPTYVRLHEQLCEDIAGGVWPLGRHVTLGELSARYGVSTNPIREALAQLQGEGLVELRMHRGAVVRSADAKFIADVYDLRGAIEGMLAAQAARRASAADVEAVARAATAYEDAVAPGVTPRIVASNREFHRAVNRIADNPVALEAVAMRSTLVDALRRTLDYGPGRLEEVVRQHRRIVDALRRGDAEAAAAAARSHTESAKADLLARMQAVAPALPRETRKDTADAYRATPDRRRRSGARRSSRRDA